jgi:hypothetical protein
MRHKSALRPWFRRLRSLCHKLGSDLFYEHCVIRGVQWGHAMGSDSLRGQAALLLSMSIEARASGHFDLSDLLTEAASRYLDRADAAERVEAPSLAPESIEPFRVHTRQSPALGRRRR